MGVPASWNTSNGSCPNSILAGHTLVGESNNGFPHPKDHLCIMRGTLTSSTTSLGLTLRDQPHQSPALTNCWRHARTHAPMHCSEHYLTHPIRPGAGEPDSPFLHPPDLLHAHPTRLQPEPYTNTHACTPETVG